MENNYEEMARTDGSTVEAVLKIAEAISEIMLDTTAPPKLRELRVQAVSQLLCDMKKYTKFSYRPDLIERIWTQKLEYILRAKSKSEIDEILQPKPPHYNGAAFVPSPYLCPEEELLAWAEISLCAPLKEAGFKRYMELFEQVYGKRIEELCA